MTKLGPIIPIPEGRKGTILKNWSTLPLEELARIMANHRGNRGVRLDEIASIDPDTEAAVKLCEQWDKEGKLPETWTYKTARGIVRRMYKRPAGLTGPLHIKEISLQLRTGSGLYDVMPPSRVTDPEKGIDGVYDWLPGLDPESINLADFPQEILCYFQTHAQIPNIGSAQRCRTPSIGNEIPYRERNNTLTSLAGSMRRRGMSQEAIEAALLAENKKCYPELPETEVISIAKSVSRYEPAGTGGTIRAPALLHQGGPHKTAWELAALLFPRVPFPWEVLPFEVAESLQTLARACATSPYSLPGAAFSLLASVLGRAAVVSAKESWDAPMITWFMDLRESGEGKTPGPRLMARVLNEAQNKAEKEYREAMEAYKRLTPKEQKKEQPPPPPRGYFVSDLTLEGLRDDLLNSPLGGIVVIQDEISAFITGQNQYKSRGNDREAWLRLYDGHPARTVRAGRAIYIVGARVSILGGIQPKVFKTFFAGENGLYLEDGTFFRFLITCEPPSYHDLTPEAWGDQDRDKWDRILKKAMAWEDEKVHFAKGEVKPTRMILSAEAQEKFFEWRNTIYAYKDQLPTQLRGFVPKAVEYVLRLTGIIHCMHRFSQSSIPSAILTDVDLERGLKAVGFYLGQIQGALRLILEEDYSPPEVSERSMLLAQTLQQLRSHLQDGRLAIGFIQKHYNLIAPETQKIGTPRGMGAVLRSMKLTIPPGKHDANGHRGVKCLAWDEYTETFLKNCLQSLQSLQSQNLHGFEDADIEDPMSEMSAEQADGFERSQDNDGIADIEEAEI